MSPDQILALCCIFAALVLAALWLRELLLDFAEQRFAEDALCDRPEGDSPFIPTDDLELICSLHGRKDYPNA